MVGALPDRARIWAWLAEVCDPEIPALSIVDLGIVRHVALDPDGRVTVTITPTYSGCPATRAIERAIADRLASGGIADARIERVLAPAWTTAWISPQGRARLHAYGIAPPQARESAIACPRCGGDATERLSRFGSTPCKELRRCRACREPFDHFKCH